MDEKLIAPRGTELFCANIVNTTFEQLSEDNIRIFRDRLLDMTGCLFGGALVVEDAFLEKRLKDWGGKPEAPLFASDGRLPLPNAVMLNCIKARANDFGNMMFMAFGEVMPSHMGETLIPMGLTLADVFGVSGREFMTANIAAEDFAGRVLYALPNRWPTDMTLVSSAAAALAGRYYGLDPMEMKAALSYGATNATDPANAYYDYSQEFKYHNGASASMGIMAAELAKGGWRGLEDPYFGHWGLISKMCADTGGIPALYEKAFDGLGKTYITESAFKRGPGGIPTTSAAFAGAKVREAIIEKYGTFQPEKIRQVHVYAPGAMARNYYDNPFKLRNQINALFSYQFAACCALLNGRVSVERVQTAAIQSDPWLVMLAEGSTMDVNAAGGRPMMKVSVDMTDGSTLAAEEDFFVMAKYPDRETLLAKFRDQFNAFGRLPKANGEKIIELAGKIDELADMREFTEVLCL
jgi:2-methylcitrate dehydratase PrpD